MDMWDLGFLIGGFRLVGFRFVIREFRVTI